MSPSLPSGWTLAILGEVCEKPEYGWTTSASEIGSVKLLRTTDITKATLDWTRVPFCETNPPNHSRFKLKSGDIVISRAGSVGVSALIDEPPNAVFASYLIRFTPLNELNRKYIAYFLQSPDYWSAISESAAGIALQNVNAKKLAAIRIPIAPLREQAVIVEEIEKQFTRLDAAVVALMRVQANLKRYRAAILKAACEGRLVPAEAELARREGRPYEPANELLKRILAERRARWEATQLTRFRNSRKPEGENWKARYKEPVDPDTSNVPNVSEGWVWGTVSQIGDVQLGRQRSPKNRSKNYPTKYIRAANITEEGIDLGDVLDMEFHPDERKRYVLQFGDIVLSEASGSPTQVGKPAIWRDELPECCFQNTVIRLRLYGLSSEYLLVAFKNYYTNGLFAKVAGGVGINHLGADKFSGISVPIPPLPEQVRIATETDRRLPLIRELGTQVDSNLKRAERLRQAILKRAFEGKLVPQDPSDEPASVLLERIRAERDANNKAKPLPSRSPKKLAQAVEAET